MSSSFICGQSGSINPAVNIDPRFIVWKTNDPNIVGTNILPAWKIVALNGAHVAVSKTSNVGGLSVVATNPGKVFIKQSLSVEDYLELCGRKVTLSVRLAEAKQLTRLILKFNDQDSTDVSVDVSSSLCDFYSATIDVPIMDASLVTNFSIIIEYNSPVDINFKYIKLEVGNVATNCPIVNLIDEINNVDSRYNGKIVGTFGRSRYRTDITNNVVDLNIYTLATGTPEIFSAIVKTSEGSTNITNMPVQTPTAFVFDVELIKRISDSDFVSRQTFISSESQVVYARYCVNGTWKEWESVGKADAISELNKNSDLHFWVGTYAEYKLIPEINIKDDVTYIITDDPPAGVYPEFDYYTRTDTLIESNKRTDLHFWVGLKSEYDAIVTKDPQTMYLITDYPQ